MKKMIENLKRLFMKNLLGIYEMMIFGVILLVILLAVVMCFFSYREPNPNKVMHTLSLTFDSNWGKGEVEPITKKEYGNVTVKMPSGSSLKKEGYYFCGWSLDAYGKTKHYQPREQYVFCGSKGNFSLEEKFYAVWRQVHTITLYSGRSSGNSYYSRDKFIKYDYILGVPEEPIDNCNLVYETDWNGDVYYKMTFNVSHIKKEYDHYTTYPRFFNSRSDGSGKMFDYNESQKLLTIEFNGAEGDFSIYPIW